MALQRYGDGNDASQNSVFYGSNNFKVEGGEYLYARRDVSKIQDNSYSFNHINLLAFHFHGPSHDHYAAFLSLNLNFVLNILKSMLDTFGHYIVIDVTRHVWQTIWKRELSKAPCKIRDCPVDPWFHLGYKVFLWFGYWFYRSFKAQLSTHPKPQWRKLGKQYCLKEFSTL
ncbi:hypothetical protein BKA70DRAFT_1227647 [Coprinopsis sp. MPI-PUGE-AT-0042]|nr:hypothetical protein BKA70DRAFT_1227647 [Coprinopsis sp. MPI-PUGE-AT-0042]